MYNVKLNEWEQLINSGDVNIYYVISYNTQFSICSTLNMWVTILYNQIV
jgi:hypothetical protein